MFLPKNSLFLLILAFSLSFYGAFCQQITPQTGSDHLGSIGVMTNPASTLSSPLRWDVLVLGSRLNNLTNIIAVGKSDSSQNLSSISINKGVAARKLNTSINLNLFSTSFKASKKMALSFGSNIRSYTSLLSSPFNFTDSIQIPDSFFYANMQYQPLESKLLTSSWLELYGSVAMNLVETEKYSINAGATLKVNRGLSGLFLNASDIRFTPLPPGGNIGYAVTAVDIDFGYSYTLEKWKSTQSVQKNLSNLVKYAESGYSLDLGFEYIVKDRRDISLYDDTPVKDYKWKFGLAILDLGYVKYKPGDLSLSSRGIKPTAQGFTLEEKFDQTVTTLKILTDSLKTVVNVFSTPNSKFNVYLPFRASFYIDRRLSSLIYVNAYSSINAASVLYGKKLFVAERDFLSITPRLENKNFGIYFPFTVYSNAEKRVGFAVRLGPLMAGFEDYSVFKPKNALENGMVYCSFRISPFRLFEKKTGVKSDKDAFRTWDSRSNQSEEKNPL